MIKERGWCSRIRQNAGGWRLLRLPAFWRTRLRRRPFLPGWNWRSWACLGLLASGLGLTGCWGTIDELPREPVAGTVLVDGKPLAEGTIVFYPEGFVLKKDHVESGAAIVHGAFSIPRYTGLVPGVYMISISSRKKRQEHKNRLERALSPTTRPQPSRKKSPRGSIPRPSSRSRSRRGASSTS